MPTQRAEFRFYAELNDFLPVERRQLPFVREVNEVASVKDMIEALGVPHTEVDLVLANGESVDFSHQVHDGDRVSVFPVFETFDITPIARVRPAPLRRVGFVLDIHLGKLARYLRLLGFDALYCNDYTDVELARISREDGRVLLTRDRGLLKRSMVTHGCCVRSTDPREQLREVVRRLDLSRSVRPFTRCMRCNGVLAAVDKAEIADLLEPKTRRYYDKFRRCGACRHIFWDGSHTGHLSALVEEVQAEGR